MGSDHAVGTFEVQLKMLGSYSSDDPTLARMSIDKSFHGDLEGTSKGEMLSAGTAIKDSAGYVAMERVTGTLAGRKGSFVFQHSATMTRGVPSLSVTVVPDSGSGDLTGLKGVFKIIIDSDSHAYEFDYELPAAQ